GEEGSWGPWVMRERTGSGWRSRMASAADSPAMPEPMMAWWVGIDSSLAWKEGQPLEGQDAARAMADTLAAGEAVAGVDGQALAGAGTDIDVDGAVVRTDAALHAARGVWNDLGFGEGLQARYEIGAHERLLSQRPSNSRRPRSLWRFFRRPFSLCVFSPPSRRSAFSPASGELDDCEGPDGGAVGLSEVGPCLGWAAV